MKLLLDTHAFIWWDDEPARLSSRVRAACADGANRVCLSIASVWELQIKAQLGKISLRLPLADVLAEQQRNGLVIVPISVEDVLELSTLPPIHRDPFDRLLIAQAQRGGFQLASHDPMVAQYGVSIFW